MRLFGTKKSSLQKQQGPCRSRPARGPNRADPFITVILTETTLLKKLHGLGSGHLLFIGENMNILYVQFYRGTL